MPTYVYACKNCGHRFEQYQSFSEDSLTSCPECAQEALRKVFDSVGIVFKGPGFYSTDSTTSGASTTASTSSSAESASTSTSTPATAAGSGSASAQPAAAAAPAS
ncbi:FmdB family zinc ribbon protein [Brachybacterium sp. UNK5269]|uniref:FmdB family zinc ribbon protein n=1 Tax=Brachybacterium sp. UNK5269 TaxID=3408576 RepID=UPI003BB1BE30